MIGENIKRIRKKRKITQIQLAKMSGLTNDYISKLELGKRENPSAEVISKIAEVLNCSTDDLITNNEIKNNLKNIREKKGLSQAELSKISGVSNVYISNLENGVKNNPSLDLIAKLADALQCSVNDILGEEENIDLQYKKAVAKIASTENDFDGVAKQLIKRFIEEGIISPSDKEIPKDTMKLIEEAIILDAKVNNNLKKKGSK